MRRQSEQGFTLIELLIVVTIISVLSAIATPGLLRARMTANETSAIASLRVSTSSQAMYAASCGSGGYARDFRTLGTPPPPGGQAFISQDLGGSNTPQKTGYNFTLGAGAGSAAGPNDCNGTATISAWYATAVPQTVGTTGSRGFAVTGGGTIWADTDGSAPAEPFSGSAVITPIQ